MNTKIQEIPILGVIKEYIKLSNDGIVAKLYCTKNDGTHLPMISECPDGETVYLSCLSCDYRLRVGWATADTLQRRINQAVDLKNIP